MRKEKKGSQCLRNNTHSRPLPSPGPCAHALCPLWAPVHTCVHSPSQMCTHMHKRERLETWLFKQFKCRNQLFWPIVGYKPVLFSSHPQRHTWPNSSHPPPQPLQSPSASCPYGLVWFEVCPPVVISGGVFISWHEFSKSAQVGGWTYFISHGWVIRLCIDRPCFLYLCINRWMLVLFPLSTDLCIYYHGCC